MGVVASVLLILSGFFLPHNKHFTNVNGQTTIQADVTVDPSVSPTDTPTATPSVSPTDTPSVTPSVSPTITPTPSATVSPSPSLSPSPTKHGDGDGDEDDQGEQEGNNGKHVGEGHTLRGILNAIFHHKLNEDRFEEKHGGK